MELIWSGSEVPRNMGMTRLTRQGYHFRRLPWIRPSPRDRQGPRQSISPSRWMSTQRHAGVAELSLSLLKSESEFLLQPALECLGRGQE